MDKLSVLKEYFGHGSFREGQEALIDAVLSGSDVLGIMPTSAGKSVCFQVPAIMLGGTALVVSPLISLMKDQVGALSQAGVSAAYLNSSLSAQEYSLVLENAARGAYRLLYVAPERLCTPSFLRFAENAELSLIAVDEAHCVSQWGQDFRPSYLRIPEFVSRLKTRPPIAAFTATATAQVREDICTMLGLRSPLVLVTGFDRKNLFFSVAHPKDKLAETLNVIRRNEGRSGIIYCSTRKTVEDVCDRLRAKGLSCGRYHGGLSDAERRSTQDDFIFDRIQYIVATNAFGMGIDKSNVGFVLHYNCPKDIESYYQEAGRAGRDGSEAECVLLYSPADIRTQLYLIDNSETNPELDEETAEAIRQRDRERLRKMTYYCKTADCLREFILHYFGEDAPNYCGRCSNCTTGFEECDVTVEAQKILSCLYRVREAYMPVAEGTVTDILRGSRAERILSRGFDKLSTYGIMSDVPTVRIRQITERLIDIGCIRQEGEYRVLVLTNKARGLLSGSEKLVMKLPKKAERGERVRPRVGDGIYELDKALFGKLKVMRYKLAEASHLPAYTIFTDSTLRDICIKHPTTTEQLLQCSGIGRRKAERYGAKVIELVKASLAENTGDNTDKKKNLGSGSDMLFKLIRLNKGKLSADGDPLSISGFCDRILEQLGIAADKNKLKEALEHWLISNNYLTRGTEDKKLTVTILSEEAGLVELDKISQNGREYKQLVILPQGQEFLVENISEIFA